jgi:hypothetical protein
MGGFQEKAWAGTCSGFVQRNRGLGGQLSVTYCRSLFYRQTKSHKLGSTRSMVLNQRPSIKKTHPNRTFSNRHPHDFNRHCDKPADLTTTRETHLKLWGSRVRVNS